MQIYLVGGAVRDTLLQIPTTDRDWLVVGSTPKAMLDAGFKAVGKEFPVFLHPHSQEEYALARIERKMGKGHAGFECYFAPDVRLEEDLLRRDLTINAIAQDENGQLIDPFHGVQDLNQRLLRHVSPAFSEDPLRVLRVARFAAKLHHLGFTIAEDTWQLMRDLVDSGELMQLTAERIWLEWQKSLLTPNPEQFLAVLQQCGALAQLIPEIDRLFGVPQSPRSHPEIDTGLHTLMVSHQASLLTDDPKVRFAAQLHDVGKGLTPSEYLPRHKGHETLGVALIEQLTKRLKVPNDYRQLALLVCQYHGLIHDAHQLSAEECIKVLNQLDVWRKPERFDSILTACQADSLGRLGFEKSDYPALGWWKQVLHTAQQIQVQDIIHEGFSGKAITEQLQLRRITAVQNALYA